MAALASPSPPQAQTIGSAIWRRTPETKRGLSVLKSTPNTNAAPQWAVFLPLILRTSAIYTAR